MTRPTFALSLALALSAACSRGESGPATTLGTADNSSARKERLLANLQAQFPELAELKPSMGDIKRIAAGMDQVELSYATPQGPHQQLMLVTPDDKALYLILEGPVDVSKSPSELAAAEAKHTAERRATLDKAVQGMPTRGPASARVTIVEFSDFECPYCKRAADTMTQVLSKHPNDVKLVFMPFPLPGHPWAHAGAVAAVCAGKQEPEAFWKLHDAYFRDQEQLTPDNVLPKTEGYLGGTKVNRETWSRCATVTGSPENQAAAALVDQALKAGEAVGVEGTPSLFINGAFINGVVSADELEQTIQKALAERS